MSLTTSVSDLVGAQMNIRVVPEVLTWDVCVLRVAVGSVSFCVCVSGEEYPSWIEQFAAGMLDDELRHVAFDPPARALRRVPRSVRAARRLRPPRVGVEHEFSVRRCGETIDFRTVLPGLFPGVVRADPADPFAVRHSWGVITSDAAEAEVATPPITIGPGFAIGAMSSAAVAQQHLRDACPDEFEFSGYSTHISVSWSPRRDDRLSQVWALTFGPAMMLLLDNPASPGLLVRPRPGRLELCGDYCDGQRLAAAVAFAAASVAHLVSVGAGAMVAYRVDADLQPARDRYGWYLDRAAFGGDLYRGADLRRSGHNVRAIDHLGALIDLVLPDLDRVGGPGDLDLMRQIRTHDLPLPLLDRTDNA